METFLYVIKNLLKGGIFTRKEALIGYALCLVLNSLIDYPLAMTIGMGSWKVRTCINVILMTTVLIKSLRSFVKSRVLLIFMTMVSCIFFLFYHLIIACIGMNWIENKYVAKDLDVTCARINSLAEQGKIKQAKLEARHLLNMYHSYYGKKHPETQQMEELLALKLG